MKVDILAFAAHPDDVELTCSGTVISHIKQGKKVAIVDLTRGELGTRGTAETRDQESIEASKIMGIHARHNLGLADGFFEHNEASVLLAIEQIRRFRPEIVLCNSVSDRHPDHGRASKLISEACFYSGLRKVETTWEGESQEEWRPKAVYHYIQDRYIKPDFIVDISDYWDLKMKSIQAYKTQFFNPEDDSEDPVSPISTKEFLDFTVGRALEYGRQIGVLYGEGFTVERTPGVTSLDKLL